MPPRKKRSESKEEKGDAVTSDDLLDSLEGDKLLFSEKNDAHTAQVSHTYNAEEEQINTVHDNKHKKIVQKRDDGISINLHLNKFTLERSIYWIIILVLAYFALFSSPLVGEGNQRSSEMQNQLFMVGDNASDEEENAQPETTEEETGGQEQPEEEEPEQQAQQQTQEKTCSNNGIALTIEEIRMNSENEREITNIILKVTNNNNNILNEFLVEVLSRESGVTTSFVHTKNYDTSPTATSDGPARFTHQNIAKCGGTRTINLGASDLAKRFVSRDVDVIFTGRILKSSDSDEVLASANRTLRKV